MMTGTRLLFALVAVCAADACAQEGALDSAFGIDGRSEYLPGADARTVAFNAVLALPDGGLLAAGYIDRALPVPLSEPNSRVVVAKLLADGKPDETYGNDAQRPGLMVFDDLSLGSRMQEAKAIARMADGSIVVGGLLDSWVFGGFTLKLDAAGQLVDGYGAGGVALLPFQVRDLAIDSHGRVVVAGMGRGAVPALYGAVARLDGASGALDGTFDEDGMMELIERAEDGSPIDRASELNALALTPDDAIVVGGYAQIDGWVDAWALARVVDGDFDATFANGGLLRMTPAWSPSSVSNVVRDIALTREGHIVVAADYRDGTDDTHAVLARFLANGAPDREFGEAVVPGFSRLELRPGHGVQTPSSLALQDDGKTLLGAITYDRNGQPSDFVVARTDAYGAFDADFGSGGVSLVRTPPPSVFADVAAIAMQGAQPIVVGANGYRDAPGEPLFVRGTVLRLTGDGVFADGFEALEPVASRQSSGPAR